MSRQTVRVTRQSPNDRAAVVGPGNLAELLDELDVFGPETLGFIVEIEEGFNSELPDGWAAQVVARP